MKCYFLDLTKNFNDEIEFKLKEFGAKIIWVSNIMPKLIAIDTDKSVKEIKELNFVEDAEEERIGTFN